MTAMSNRRSTVAYRELRRDKGASSMALQKSSHFGASPKVAYAAVASTLLLTDKVTSGWRIHKTPPTGTSNV